METNEEVKNIDIMKKNENDNDNENIKNQNISVNSDSEYENGGKASTQNFKLIYSPRTRYSIKLEREEDLYKDLTINFDPITIKIIKKHFKERLGSIENIEFISILKNHLLSWHPEHPNRQKILIKLLHRLFSEIDLNDNGSMEWAEFTNYIIHNSNPINQNGENDTFKLKSYSLARKTIDTKDMAENIGYSFYIEKSSMIGLVENDKSVIHFYDANSLKKLKLHIDLRDIQKDIDFLELRELDEKAENKKKLEKEEKIKLKIIRLKNQKKFSPNGDEENIQEKGNIHTANSRSPEKIKPSASKILSSSIAETQNRKQIATSIINKKLTVLCTCYLQEFDVLLVSGSNNRISAWRYSTGEFRNVNTISQHPNIDRNYFLCCILMSDSPQYTMTWDPMQRYLYTGQIDGKILKWDLTRSNHIAVLDIIELNNKEKLLKKPNTFTNEDEISKNENSFEEKSRTKNFTKSKYVKRDSVSYILLISKIQLLAASYLNGTIILWDTLLMEKRKAYDDHKSGIYQMSYDSTKNLLFSCGFSKDIYVYDPYIDFPVYKLSGHYGSINNIISNEKESEIISLDVHGIMKIWDSTALSNFQTINVEESNHNSNRLSSNLKIIYLKKQKKIMSYGNKIQFYETDRSLNPDLADDQIIFACLFDKVSVSLITFCLRKIKLWDPFTGKIKKIYEDPMKSEITAYCIDRNMKRTFLGDNSGKIKNFNMKNGKYLKDLTPHNLEVNIILHSIEMNIVISCSIDNVIKIHSDKELIGSFVMKEIVILGFQIKAIAILEHLKRLAIGLSNGVIKFYDIEHLRYDSDLNSDSKSSYEEVISIFPFKDIELIFSTHSNGACRFIVAPPSSFKFNVIHEFYNTSIKDQNYKISVTAVDFDYNRKLLFCGDQLGCLTCYDLNVFNDLVEKTKIHSTKHTHNLVINNEFINQVKHIQLQKLWCTDGHTESIKHLHFANIDPNIIIATSHDIKVKIFKAANGEYIDELKQISNKFNSVPIGIKYEGVDPINKNPFKQTVWRRDLNKIGFQNVEEIEEKTTTEYSNKITILNAKEKLMQYCRNVKVAMDNSNKWNLMINIKNFKKEEEDQLRVLFSKVAKKDLIITQAEEIMQKKSIYAENYQPLFVNEMDEDKIKEFSKTLSQKLRHVKLAISKANINQIKYSNMVSGSPSGTNKLLGILVSGIPEAIKKISIFNSNKSNIEKKPYKKDDNNSEKKKKSRSQISHKSNKSFSRSMDKTSNKSLEKLSYGPSNKNLNSSLVGSSNRINIKNSIVKNNQSVVFKDENSSNKIFNKVLNLKPIIIKGKSTLADYIKLEKKDLTSEETFINCKTDLDKHLKDLEKPFELLRRKGKIKPLNLKNRASLEIKEKNVKNFNLNFE